MIFVPNSPVDTTTLPGPSSIAKMNPLDAKSPRIRKNSTSCGDIGYASLMIASQNVLAVLDARCDGEALVFGISLSI